MANYLDRMVTLYDNKYGRRFCDIPISKFLFSSKHKSTILAIRAETDKKKRDKMKLTLPQATISGTFAPCRRQENLIKHSGLICADIDAGDNPSMDMAALKEKISKDQHVFYIGYSASGKGLTCILPIKYPEMHASQFDAMARQFLKLNVKIDPAYRTVSQMKCISYDPEAYINDNAVEYQGIWREPIRKRHFKGDADEDYRLAATLCKEIEERGIDITQGYQNWWRIGAALSSLGERGRDLFHIVSSQNDKYRESETDKKFSNLLEKTSGIGLGTFIMICERYGIH